MQSLFKCVGLGLVVGVLALVGSITPDRADAREANPTASAAPQFDQPNPAHYDVYILVQSDQGPRWRFLRGFADFQSAKNFADAWSHRHPAMVQHQNRVVYAAP